MDWLSNNVRKDEFQYWQVSRDDLENEVGLLGGITGGSLEWNDMSDIKTSGSLDYIEKLAVGNDFLRVVSVSTDLATGEFERVVHGTYLVSTPSSTYRGAIEEGTADLYSVLQILAEDYFEEPFVLKAGATAVTAAANIVVSAGLPVVASPSDVQTVGDVVFDSDDSKLEIVNSLLEMAGFAAADCDGYGRVLFRPCGSDPRTPRWSLADDSTCVFRSGIAHECDAFSVPNVVVVGCKSSGEEDVAPGIAVNGDPSSPFSIGARGRRIVLHETVSNVADHAALQAKAEKILLEKMALADDYEVVHSYIPLNMGEVCELRYAKAGVHCENLVAVRRSMKLRPGMECATHFRRCVRLFDSLPSGNES